MQESTSLVALTLSVTEKVCSHASGGSARATPLSSSFCLLTCCSYARHALMSCIFSPQDHQPGAMVVAHVLGYGHVLTSLSVEPTRGSAREEIRMPPMDELHVALTHEESPASNDGIGVSATLMLNYAPLPYVLDINQFFEAVVLISWSPVRLPLFTCTCGVFGCGGYYVDVECTTQAWVLRNRYHPDTEELLEEMEYWLSWRQVHEVADELVTVLRAVHAHRPTAQLTSGAHGQNLVAKMEAYNTCVGRLMSRGRHWMGGSTAP